MFIYSQVNFLLKIYTKLVTVNPVCTLESSGGWRRAGEMLFYKMWMLRPYTRGTKTPQVILMCRQSCQTFPCNSYNLLNLPNLLGFLQNLTFQQEGAHSNIFPRCPKVSPFPWGLTGPSANRQSEENQ